MTIRTRMILWILGGTLVVLLSILAISYFTGKEAVVKVSRRSLSNLVNSYAARFEADFRQVSQVPKDLALTLEIFPDLPEPKLLSLLADAVADNGLVYGSAIAFEPYVYHKDRYYYSPYFYRNDTQVQFVQLGNEQYRYFDWDWYMIPKLLQKPIWTEPYYDEGGGGTIMTTYSVPFFNPDSTVRGIVTADVDLEELRKSTSEVRVAETGYAFVISHNGTFITHPDSTYVMRESIFSIAESPGRQRLRQLGKRMVSGESGIERIEDFWRGGSAWLAFTPIRSSQWSFAVILPENEMMAVVLTLSRRLILFMLAGLIGLFIVVTIISYSLTQPLKKLAGAAGSLAKGNLDARITDIKHRDEVGELALTFNKMVEDLKQYIQDLTETTRAKERVERELSIARQIQQSILPHTYPPFPEQKELDIYALTHPAREVGGDFYDFFLIDEDHLGFLVADVSGKGVPAALFMAVTRTLIKTASSGELSPRRTLEQVNATIYPENDSSMFITVFYAIYDIRNGSIRFANAGHNLPFIKRFDGTVEMIPMTRSIALGIMEDVELEEGSIELHKNDIILFYTDGLTEASTADYEMYEEERLREFLATTEDSENMKVFIHRILNSVEEFVGGAEQFDDITILALRRLV